MGSGRLTTLSDMHASWFSAFVAATLLACPVDSDPSYHTQSDISVRCLFHTIELRLPKNGTESKGNVYVGSNGMLASTFCRFPSSGRMTIPFPFDSCGTEPQSDRTNVTFVNSIWKVWLDGVEKYADFSCTYDNSFRTAIPHPQPAVLKNLPSDDGDRSRAVLCSTPFYCPRYVCPEERSQPLYALYFDSDVMHVKVALEPKSKAEEASVAAIESLFVTCGQSLSDSTVQYHSVTNGCQSRSATLGRRWDRNTLQTYVDFNAHADTVCMTVTVPPSTNCPVFYIHGTLKRCNASSSEMCEDYSGAQCPGEGLAKSHFAYGPVYVMSRAEGRSLVHLHRTETTTQKSPTTLDTFADPDLDIETQLDAFGEFVDGRSPSEQKSKGGLEPEAKKPGNTKEQIESKHADAESDDFDVAPVATPQTPKTRLVKTTMTFSATKRTTSPSKPVAPVFVVGEKRNVTPEVHPATELDRPSSENLPAEKKGLQPPQNIPQATEATKRTDRHRGTFHRATRPAMADVVPDSILQEAIMREAAEDEKPAVDRVGGQNIRGPVTSTAHGVGKRLSLRQFNASESSEVFIWAAVSSLAIFLLASIGLLIAWTAVRSRKKTRRF